MYVDCGCDSPSLSLSQCKKTIDQFILSLQQRKQTENTISTSFATLHKKIILRILFKCMIELTKAKKENENENGKIEAEHLTNVANDYVALSFHYYQ